MNVIEGINSLHDDIGSTLSNIEFEHPLALSACPEEKRASCRRNQKS